MVLNIINPHLPDRELILNYENPALWVGISSLLGIFTVGFTRYSHSVPVFSSM